MRLAADVASAERVLRLRQNRRPPLRGQGIAPFGRRGCPNSTWAHYQQMMLVSDYNFRPDDAIPNKSRDFLDMCQKGTFTPQREPLMHLRKPT